jgi:hypothetical protein
MPFPATARGDPDGLPSAAVGRDRRIAQANDPLIAWVLRQPVDRFQRRQSATSVVRLEIRRDDSGALMKEEVTDRRKKEGENARQVPWQAGRSKATPFLGTLQPRKFSIA